MGPFHRLVICNFEVTCVIQYGPLCFNLEKMSEGVFSRLGVLRRPPPSDKFLFDLFSCSNVQ